MSSLQQAIEDEADLRGQLHQRAQDLGFVHLAEALCADNADAESFVDGAVHDLQQGRRSFTMSDQTKSIVGLFCALGVLIDRRNDIIETVTNRAAQGLNRRSGGGIPAPVWVPFVGEG